MHDPALPHVLLIIIQILPLVDVLYVMLLVLSAMALAHLNAPLATLQAEIFQMGNVFANPVTTTLDSKLALVKLHH